MSAEPVETVQARTGRARRLATVNDILDATRRLLVAGAPVASLSVDQIAQEAGLARATFYKHFADKHAIIASLAADEIAWREEVGAEAVADPDLTRETLDVMLREVVVRWSADRSVLSAIIELAEYDEQVKAIWAASMRSVAEKAGAQFRIRWAGKTDSADPDAIAEVFTWMFERCCHQMLNEPDSIDRVSAAMSEIVWRVLTYPPGS